MFGTLYLEPDVLLLLPEVLGTAKNDVSSVFIGNMLPRLALGSLRSIIRLPRLELGIGCKLDLRPLSRGKKEKLRTVYISDTV